MRTVWKLLCSLAAVGALASGGLLRTRAKRLEALDRADAEDETRPEAGWAWITAKDVRVDEETRAAACRHAKAAGLDVLDLVPADLPVHRALELLRDADPNYRGNRLAPGLTARQALVARKCLLDRAGISPSADIDDVGFVRVARELKQYCPTTMDVVVAPGLRSTSEDLARRRGLWTMKIGKFAPLAVGVPGAGYLFLAAALVLVPFWGLAALAAWCAIPIIALAGTQFRPPKLVHRSFLRWLHGPYDLLLTARGRWRPPPEVTGIPDPESLRADYALAVANGIEEFFEERVDDCPICGSQQLEIRLTTPDLLQGKPGTFELDRCDSCGLVFQNPRLSLEGLNYYYRDAYDGLGSGDFGWLAGAYPWAYRDRAAMLKGRDVPGRWLDVGAGQGHFCLVAKESWPDTVFDGLDMSANIEIAERKGWVSKGHRGQLPELADKLAGTYDVVSMHHYLEHTRDPLREIDAAIKVLKPGGHLVIEVPDPEFAFGQRLCGRYWPPWFQPQHLNMLPLGLLTAELERRGMLAVEIQRGQPHIPADFAAALWRLLCQVAPKPGLPWRSDGDPYARIRRRVALAVGGPLLAGALAVDLLVTPFIRRGSVSNTYRVLAQAAGGE